MDTGANVHVCANISLFSSYQVDDTGALLMGNGSYARVLGVGMVILKFHSEVHFRKHGADKECVACPLHQKKSS